VIIDLEDAVRPERKERARTAAAEWLERGRAWIRLNPLGTREALLDLDRCAAAPGVAGLVVPKSESTSDLDRLVEEVGPDLPLIALIESARGLLAAGSIAAHPGVRLLAFGNLDFAADCGLPVTGPDEPELFPARLQLTVVSRAAGLPGPVDGVTAEIRDMNVTAHDAAWAAGLGYSGKLCVHPAQVPVVNDAFAPPADQVEWATRVVEAVTGGVAVIDGRMVDRPVLTRARQILGRMRDGPAEDCQRG
jgi:citrate lyase subunit beta/citryl-CoA lyase